MWAKKSENDIVLSPEKWYSIWKRLGDKYGRCHINISGGEPSTYPGFLELVRLLSEIHELEICTNLTFDISSFLSFSDTKNIIVAPTYHSIFSKFEPFLERVKRIREFLPNRQVYCVGHGKQVDNMDRYRNRFKAIGVTLVPLPLIGDDQGFKNTKEEKKKLVESSPYKGKEKLEYQIQKISPKGKECAAGCKYALIHADGSVVRCSRDTEIFGNILDKGFSLFSSPVVCEQEKCPLESQWIVD